MKRTLALGAERMARRARDPLVARARDEYALRGGTLRGADLRRLVAGRTTSSINEISHAARGPERAWASRIARDVARDRLRRTRAYRLIDGWREDARRAGREGTP